MNDEIERGPVGFAMPAPQNREFRIEIHLVYTDAARAVIKRSAEDIQFHYVAGVPLPAVGDAIQVGLGDFPTMRVKDRTFTFKADRMSVDLLLDLS